MNTDATALQNALDVLRRHYGERLAGARQRTEDQMRNTLAQELGVDQLGAAFVLKRLCQTGQLEYVGNTGTGTGTGTGTDTGEDTGSGVAAEPGASATGPVISMPLTQTAEVGRPLITTASPAMLMGITNEQGGDAAPDQADAVEGETLGWLLAPAVEPGEVHTATEDREQNEGEHAEGYWRIG